MKIDIYNIIGKMAVSRESGIKIKALIEGAINGEEEVILDFEGVVFFASPFFNTSIAPILGVLTLEKMRSVFSFINITPVGRDLLNQVIHNAIDFYSKSEGEQGKIQDNVDQGLE